MMTAHEYAHAMPCIDRDRALALVRDHGLLPGEFDHDMGVHEAYDTLEVIGWLGY